VMADQRLDRLIVAIFGDNSERTLPWAERVDVAIYRMNRRVDLEDPPGSGLMPSLAEALATTWWPHSHTAQVTATVTLSDGGG